MYKKLVQMMATFFHVNNQTIRVIFVKLLKNNIDESCFDEERWLLKPESSISSKDNDVQIIAVNNRLGIPGLKKIEAKFIKTLHDNVLGLIFFCTKKKEARQIHHFFETYNNISLHTFGINPDYYFSVVPINTPNRVNIEKYIFNLTSDGTIIGKIKNRIKLCMINLKQSDILYESYAVLLTFDNSNPNFTHQLN